MTLNHPKPLFYFVFLIAFSHLGCEKGGMLEDLIELDREAALARLEEGEVPYTQEEFIKRIRHKEEDTVKVFLWAGMDPNTKDAEGIPAIVWAANRGTLDMVERLLSGGARVDASGSDGWTPLMWASRRGKTPLARRLIAASAEVNATGDQANTPLMEASFYGHLETVELLLSEGADIDARDKEGHSALIWAQLMNQTEIIKTLKENGAREFKMPTVAGEQE